MEGVQIVAQRARVHHWILRDDADTRAQISQAQATRVETVDLDGPASLVPLHQTQQRLEQRALARACTPTYTDLLARRNVQIHTL